MEFKVLRIFQGQILSQRDLIKTRISRKVGASAPMKVNAVKCGSVNVGWGFR